MAREPVILNIYDMYCMNDFTTLMGFGLFHSGIEVYGVEYAYGGHPYTFSGIFDTSPKNADDLGPQFRFRESIELGQTDLTENEVVRVIAELGKKYTGDKYHLLNKNCNHFSEELSQILCGSEIPPWVNRLAYLSCMPFLRRWLRKMRARSISWQHSFT